MENKNSSISKITDIFKLLADPTRLKILRVLFGSRKEMCVNEISEKIGMSHSATSHQLAKLEVRGIVSCARIGKKMCYEICENPTTRNIKKTIMMFI